MSFLGIDLHPNRITVARLAVKGEAFETITRTYNFEREPFNRFLDPLTEHDYALVENTFNAFWFYDQIAGRVKESAWYTTPTKPVV